MTKLESYHQLGGSFNATQFYADIEGHPEDRQCAAIGAGGTRLLHLEADGDARQSIRRTMSSATTCLN